MTFRHELELLTLDKDYSEFELSTICRQLRLVVLNGKKYETGYTTKIELSTNCRQLKLTLSDGSQVVTFCHSLKLTASEKCNELVMNDIGVKH